MRNHRTTNTTRVKWCVFALLVLFGLNISLSNSVKEKIIIGSEATREISHSEIPSSFPSSASLSENNNYTGIGQPLTAVEHSWAENLTQQVDPFENETGGCGYVDVPPGWTAYELTVLVDDVRDNKTWEDNGAITGDSDWNYQEFDDEDGDDSGTDPDENCWGWYNATPPEGTETGALFLHHGYMPGDDTEETEYAQFSQTINNIPREDISGVRFEFSYWGNSTQYGISRLFVELNGYRRYFPVFEPPALNNTWVNESFHLSPTEINTYFASDDVNILVGIDVFMDVLTVTPLDGYTYEEVYFDNISLWLEAQANPEQIALTVNGEPIPNTGVGTGEVTLTEVDWTNPSGMDFTPMAANFSFQNTKWVKLYTDLTVKANRTKLTKAFDGSLGTDFLVSNNSLTNWTTYFNVYSPFRYKNYNLSIFFPDEWDLWAVYNSSSKEILNELSSGTNYLDVDPAHANAPGLWRFEFSTTNCLSTMLLQKNQTTLPSNWIEAEEILSGEFLNVSAQITCPLDVTATKAVLTVKFPSGSVWNTPTQFQEVPADGKVNFIPIEIPKENSTEYISGTYTIIVTWNNSRDVMALNQTGVITSTIDVRHYSTIVPDDAYISNVLEGDNIDIYVSFLDLKSLQTITGGSVVLTNLTGGNQLMTMVTPGYYYVETKAVASAPGEKNLTIQATHPSFNASSRNITVEIKFGTEIATPKASDSILFGNNFTFRVNYTQTKNGQGITGGTIQTDWTEEWSVIDEGDGNYTITGRVQQSSNRNPVLTITAGKDGFRPATLITTIIIQERNSTLNNLFVDGTNVTRTKTIDIPLTRSFEVTLGFYDSEEGWLISDAVVTCEGLGSEKITLTNVGDKFKCTIEGSLLDTGTHYALFSATRENYQSQSLVLEINVHKIRARTVTEDSNTVFNLSSSNAFSLKVLVENLDFGGLLQDCEVSYQWEKGSGNLTDADGDGTYEVDFSEVPPGAWDISIFVYKGPDYEIEQITITVIVPEPNNNLRLYYMFILGVVISSIFFILAIYKFKNRPSWIQRVIRITRIGIRRGNPPPILIRNSDRIFFDEYIKREAKAMPKNVRTEMKRLYSEVEMREDMDPVEKIVVEVEIQPEEGGGT